MEFGRSPCKDFPGLASCNLCKFDSKILVLMQIWCLKHSQMRVNNKEICLHVENSDESVSLKPISFALDSKKWMIPKRNVNVYSVNWSNMKHYSAVSKHWNFSEKNVYWYRFDVLSTPKCVWIVKWSISVSMRLKTFPLGNQSARGLMPLLVMGQTGMSTFVL